MLLLLLLLLLLNSINCTTLSETSFPSRLCSSFRLLLPLLLVLLLSPPFLLWLQRILPSLLTCSSDLVHRCFSLSSSSSHCYQYSYFFFGRAFSRRILKKLRSVVTGNFLAFWSFWHQNGHSYIHTSSITIIHSCSINILWFGLSLSSSSSRLMLLFIYFFFFFTYRFYRVKSTRKKKIQVRG